MLPSHQNRPTSNKLLPCELNQSGQVCDLSGVQAANDAMREALKPEDLQQYAIMGRDTDFEQALPDGAVPASGIVNVKSSEARTVADKGNPQKKEGKLYKKDGKTQQGRKHHSSGVKSGQNKKQRT